MNEEDLAMYMSEFICNQGLWNVFLEEMKKKGFTEEELEDI